MSRDVTDKPARESTWRASVRLLAFGLFAALILFLVLGPPAGEQNLTRIELTTADVAQVRATFERTWNRPPTAVELQRAFEEYVRSEVLYREALARGLDRNDPVVKMSLVRKITLLGSAAASDAEPTDEEIEAYFDLRAERYRLPASVSMMQIYLNRDRRGDAIDADAASLLAQLKQEDPGAERVTELGDASMLPNVLRGVSDEDVARRFGESFRQAIVSLPIGLWQGPVESGFGLHMVKISERVDSRIPAWTEVRERVRNDLLYEARQAAEDQFYAEVVPRYQLVYAEEAIAALEGE